MTTIFVLGAPDAEMTTIEALLRGAGKTVAYATVDGTRVHPGNAYKALMPLAAIEHHESSRDNIVVLVECCATPAGSVPSPRVVRIDHHFPGDPGYGLPPHEFMRGSSLGQTISLLARQDALPADWRRIPDPCDSMVMEGRDGSIDRWLPGTLASGEIGPHIWGVCRRVSDYRHEWIIIPEQIVIMAAADHCLAAAYQGQCPGVDPEALLAWRMVSRAAFQGRSVAEVEVETAAAREALRSAPALLAPIDFGIRDLRAVGSVPELPEAACREGICYVTEVMEPTGRRKIVCGAGTPEQIRAFQRWAEAEGLTGIYGDPARGFAGGYPPETVAARSASNPVPVPT